MIDRGEIDPRDKRSYSSNATGVSPVGLPDMRPNLKLGQDKIGRKRWLRTGQPPAEQKPAGQAPAPAAQPVPAQPATSTLDATIAGGAKAAWGVLGAVPAIAQIGFDRFQQALQESVGQAIGEPAPEARPPAPIAPIAPKPAAPKPAAKPETMKAAIVKRKAQPKPTLGQKALNVAKSAGKVALGAVAGAALAAGTAHLAGKAGKAIEGSTPTGRNRQYQRAAAVNFRGKTIDAARGQASAPTAKTTVGAPKPGPAEQAQAMTPAEQARRELAMQMAEEYRRRLMERYTKGPTTARPKAS